jgi:hypothetical protein
MPPSLENEMLSGGDSRPPMRLPSRMERTHRGHARASGAARLAWGIQRCRGVCQLPMRDPVTIRSAWSSTVPAAAFARRKPSPHGRGSGWRLSAECGMIHPGLGRRRCPNHEINGRPPVRPVPSCDALPVRTCRGDRLPFCCRGIERQGHRTCNVSCL